MREEYEVKRAGRGGSEERKDGGGIKGTDLVQNVLLLLHFILPSVYLNNKLGDFLEEFGLHATNVLNNSLI